MGNRYRELTRQMRQMRVKLTRPIFTKTRQRPHTSKPATGAGPLRGDHSGAAIPPLVYTRLSTPTTVAPTSRASTSRCTWRPRAPRPGRKIAH